MKKIAALLSGGVDSASALARYIETNPENKQYITAYYLKIWLEDEMSFLGDCPWEEDLHYAEAVSKQLGVKLEVISLQREYYDLVVSYTIDELKLGGTPSPDIFCNQRIKFGVFLDRVQDVDYIITGHYAQTNHNPSRLFRSPDPIKDQTYFLSHLSEEQVGKIILPLGPMQKHEVREYAKKHALAPCDRKDSQGICFLGKIKYSDFVKYHMGTKEGDIIDKDSGKILGKHQGSWFYTIGQRSGLGLGGGPWFVSKKSLEENIVWVQHGEKLPNEVVSDIPVSKLHLIHKLDPSYLSEDQKHIRIDNILVKIRHGKDIIPSRFEYDIEQDKGLVSMSKGDSGVAAGQFTVLYIEEECIGCARISPDIN